MLGDKGAHRPAFTAYLAALRAGATSQEAAVKAFGSIEKLSVDLQHYISGMSFAYVGTPAPAKVADSALQVRELSQAETNAYRGGFLAIQGQFKQAEPLLAAAVRDDPKLALAQQNMTFLHLARQEWKDAFASASAAIALAPNDGFMRFIRAELAFRRDVTSHEDPQIETDLRQSITTNPDFAPAYDMLATFLAVNNKDLPEALAFAEKARAMEPGTSEYQFSVARVLAQMRRYKEAETLLLAARSRSKDAAFTSRADELLDYLKKATEYDAQRLEQERAYAVYNAERANETPTDKAGVTPDARDTTPEPYDNSRGVELKHRGLSAEGRVTRVTCQGNTMQVTIEVGGVPMVLRAADRTTVNYTDDRPSKSGDIEPCKEMQGRNAAILFRTDNDNKEILSISLRR
jgi:thioredoxin-like negative regulator of GroEL